MSDRPSPTEMIFTDIFRENKWKGRVPSGPGSSLEATKLVRPGLEALFKRMQIRTLCDAPCGDGSWIFTITNDLDLYLGIDVVHEVIARNTALGLPLNHLFAKGDITQDIPPKVDAILCRDCLVHLPLEIAMQALSLFRRSGSTYLITTTFPDRTENPQARMGSWRPLNLAIAPFNLPQPIEIVRERHPDPNDRNNDKSLGVWRLDSLSL